MTAPEKFEGDGAMAQVVERGRIGEPGDFNLSGERYRKVEVNGSTHSLVPARQFMKVSVPTLDPRTTPDEIFELWSIPAYDAGQPELVCGSEIGSQKNVFTRTMCFYRELFRTFAERGR